MAKATPIAINIRERKSVEASNILSGPQRRSNQSDGNYSVWQVKVV